MIKRIIAMSMAIILAAGMLLPAVYADSGTAAPQVTVVGKRIIGDDKYFEISLEVDGDYEDYSSVGVVLQYDPSLIVPTTWDDEAVPVDMSQSTSWATRRALPTLGKDTWTTHTALTYITEETDGGGNKKNVGYLYLGAEYPGKLPNSASDPNATPDPNATASPTVAPTPTAEPTPTPDPNATPDPDPYVNPVVVARFMYVGADETAQKASKDSITNQWTAGNWDADWTKNKILTIAPDKISDASPAQFGFTIYNADFTMKGFQFDYTTTVLETAEQAQTTDIQIVLGEGKSAKAGGLSLNDIYVTMFFDWDDSIIGSLTCGMGQDSREAINNYAKEKFVHPDLRDVDYSTLTDAQLKERQYSYRGKYPSISPTAGDTYPDGGDNPGSDYPLTNKLEYTTAGKTLDIDYPFANCWTLVSPDNMEDTWTSLANDDKKNKVVTKARFNKMPELDPTTGQPVDPTEVIPEMVSYDFEDVQESDLDGGVLYVKAVYVPGQNLDVSNAYYTAVGPVKYSVISTSITAAAATYAIDFDYERVNSKFNGVTRLREPKVQAELTINGASKTIYLSTNTEKNNNYGEYLHTQIITNKEVTKVAYKMIDVYGKDIVGGTVKSSASGLGAFVLTNNTFSGIKIQATLNKIVEYIEAGKKTSVTYLVLQDTDVRKNTDGDKFTKATEATAVREYINTFVTAAKVANGGETPTITYFQLQWAILNGGAYLSADDAKSACSIYSWCI